MDLHVKSPFTASVRSAGLENAGYIPMHVLYLSFIGGFFPAGHLEYMGCFILRLVIEVSHSQRNSSWLQDHWPDITRDNQLGGWRNHQGGDI